MKRQKTWCHCNETQLPMQPAPVSKQTIQILTLTDDTDVTNRGSDAQPSGARCLDFSQVALCSTGQLHRQGPHSVCEVSNNSELSPWHGKAHARGDVIHKPPLAPGAIPAVFSKCREGQRLWHVTIWLSADAKWAASPNGSCGTLLTRNPCLVTSGVLGDGKNFEPAGATKAGVFFVLLSAGRQ
jgi:hypothetical protein